MAISTPLLYEGDLAFLNEIRINPDDDEPSAPWLHSNFYENIWTINHPGHETATFNWNRIMPTGIMLTSNGVNSTPRSSKILLQNDVSESEGYVASQDYRKILNLLKRMVFYIRHRRISRKCSLNYHTICFYEIITFAEWLILHGDRFKPLEHLFELVDSKDLEDEYIPLWVTGGKASLLNLEPRLVESLQAILIDIDRNAELKDRLETIISETPRIAFIEPAMQPWLWFPEHETRLLRAWLQKNGYHHNTCNQLGTLKTQVLFNDLTNQKVKSDTLPVPLRAKLRTLSAAEPNSKLDFSPKNQKEYFPAGNKRLYEKALLPPKLSASRLEWIKGFMEKIQKTSRHIDTGLPSPSVFNHISYSNIEDSHSLRPVGSTKTIPPEVAIHCLGEAVGFVINYGEELIEYACKIKSEVNRARNDPKWKNTPNLAFLSAHHEAHIPSFSGIPNELVALNITQLNNVYGSYGLPKFNGHGGNARAAVVRKHMGLEDALNILIASAIVIIGTTAARRQIEIRTLDNQCLEKILGSGWYLRFELGKDNFGSIKGKPARCIPNIAAKAIKLIVKLNRHWQEEHGETSDKLFFGYSGELTECKHLSVPVYNRFLDNFCDYVEVPLDNEGKRWYIRTHEMRRFWAYSFFYKFGLGELHIIGWFLGHAEAEHTWAYIRESFDGHDKEMQRIKAAYAADILKGSHSSSRDNDSAIEYIKQMVLMHFNRNDIELIEKEELIDFLAEIVKKTELEIEPKFIRDTNGTDYDLIWLVRKDRP
ncbi:hypothetical protein ACFL3K_00350 [Pseudomonadota bacterium]